MRKPVSFAIVLIIDVLLLGILPVLFLVHLLIAKSQPNLFSFTEITASIESYLYFALFPFELFAPFLFITLPVPLFAAIIVIVSSIALWRGNLHTRAIFFFVIGIPLALELLAHVLNLLLSLANCGIEQGHAIECLAPCLAVFAGRLVFTAAIVSVNWKLVPTAGVPTRSEPAS